MPYVFLEVLPLKLKLQLKFNFFLFYFILYFYLCHSIVVMPIDHTIHLQIHHNITLKLIQEPLSM